MRILLVLLFSLSLTGLSAQSSEEKVIRSILTAQTAAWNSGRLEDFMRGYWQSDSLLFIGKSGLTYGYQRTLANYRKGYPDTAAMGRLTFTLLELKPLGKDLYLVVGKWQLKRSIGDVQGHFSLTWRKFPKAGWKIIADHSS